MFICPQQVDTSSVYVTKTQDRYVTNTYTVTATITSSVPHYVTTTSEINHYVTVTKECNAPVKSKYAHSGLKAGNNVFFER